MTISIILTLIGFILSILSTNAHFSTTHGILGLIVFIIMFVQPVFGILSILPFKPMLKKVIFIVRLYQLILDSSLDWENLFNHGII